MAVGQHSPITVWSLVSKAGLWGLLWSVRASIGDPGDGSFGWVSPLWGERAGWIEVPAINLGFLPWRFVLRVQSEGGVPYRGPNGEQEVRLWIGPRSVRWVRMEAMGPINAGEYIRLELCTDPALGWLRSQECHRYAATGFM